MIYYCYVCKLCCRAEHWNLFLLCNSLSFLSPFSHCLSLTFAFNITSSSILHFPGSKDVIGHVLALILLTFTCLFLSIKLLIIILQFSPKGRVNSKKLHWTYFSPLQVYVGKISIYSRSILFLSLRPCTTLYYNYLFTHSECHPHWLLTSLFVLFFCFFNNYLFIYLFIYGCVGSSFLCEGFLQLQRAGATLHRGARASHCRGLSCCGAQAPDAQAQ